MSSRNGHHRPGGRGRVSSRQRGGRPALGGGFAAVDITDVVIGTNPGCDDPRHRLDGLRVHPDADSGRVKKPPRKKYRRLIGPVELPKSDAELLREAARSAARSGVVGGTAVKGGKSEIIGSISDVPLTATNRRD